MGGNADTSADINETMEGGERAERRRCAGRTRAGLPCRRMAVRDSLCRQHGRAAQARPGPTFYARALDPDEREAYAEALALDGLTGEVAVLRLHLLHLLERDDRDRSSEVARTVLALVRAIRETRGNTTAVVAALDAAVREEGQRVLDSAESGYALDGAEERPAQEQE